MTTALPSMATARKVIAAASATALLYLLWRSLEWPLIHHTALMHYIAWLISQGAVPYRDTFDMNMPGVYLIHLTVLAVGAAGDLAWRVFDLGWLAATAGLMYLYCLSTADSRIQALRAEFMAGLEARPPAAIVAFPGRGANGPYGRLADFPALNQFLDRRYAPVVEGNGYRIYGRRSGP